MEFSKELEDWKRVRSVVEHENLLINYRVTWLLTSQGFLFTAFTFLFNSWQTSDKYYFIPVLFTISFIGFSVCIFILIGLCDATIQLFSLDNWWYSKYKSTEECDLDLEKLKKFPARLDGRSEMIKRGLEDHPPMQGGNRNYIADRILRITHLPYLFMFSWGGIIILILVEIWPGNNYYGSLFLWLM